MMKPKMCHLNYQPVTTLQSHALDFDLLELEKINFSVKMEHMAEQLNKEQEIATPTFKYKKNKIQGPAKEINNRIENILCVSPQKLIKSTRRIHRMIKEPLQNTQI